MNCPKTILTTTYVKFAVLKINWLSHKIKSANLESNLNELKTSSSNIKCSSNSIMTSKTKLTPRPRKLTHSKPLTIKSNLPLKKSPITSRTFPFNALISWRKLPSGNNGTKTSSTGTKYNWKTNEFAARKLSNWTNKNSVHNTNNASKTWCTKTTSLKKHYNKNKLSKISLVKGSKRLGLKKMKRLTGSKEYCNNAKSHMKITCGKKMNNSKGWKTSSKKWSTSILKTLNITKKTKRKSLAFNSTDSDKWSVSKTMK